MEKKKVGFILPTELIELMAGVGSRVGGKEKWVVVAAAIVHFLQQTEDVQNQMIAKVKGADAPGGSIAKVLGAKHTYRMKVAAKHADDDED